MGAARRPQPLRLGSKLLQIRKFFGLTQEQMAGMLEDVPSPPQPAHVSRFEQGVREPSLLVLLAYARVAVIPVEVLIDDKLDLSTNPTGRDVRRQRKTRTSVKKKGKRKR
jgi:transcriptional regulator with XRE-family HTH domain